MKNSYFQILIAFINFFLIALIFSSNNFIFSLKLEIKLKNTNSLESKSQSSSTAAFKLTTKYCSPLCEECSMNDLNYCTRCGTEGIYYNFGCYKRCPEGTYLNRESKQCDKCNDKCPVCWDFEEDTCGTTPGVKSQVVKIHDEIENFMKFNKFTNSQIENWLNTLKYIFDGEKEEFPNKDTGDTFTTKDVYNTENDKIIELPIGSHSKLDGVFVPVPTYLNKKKQLIKSHWIYKKGMWDGKRWIAQYFPRLPSFIKLKGEKNLIYYENGGYWAWDQMKDWYWIKADNVIESNGTIQDYLNILNRMKFDVFYELFYIQLGEYDEKKIRENFEIKKLSIQNGLKDFFNNFVLSDKQIFSELKHTMQEEQNNLINSLDILKDKVHEYFGEEIKEDKNEKIIQKNKQTKNNHLDKVVVDKMNFKDTEKMIESLSDMLNKNINIE